jgi:hypothetical protein
MDEAPAATPRLRMRGGCIHAEESDQYSAIAGPISLGSGCLGVSHPLCSLACQKAHEGDFPNQAGLNKSPQVKAGFF